MSTTRHIATTIAQYSITLVVAIVVNFALPRLAPGDPANYLIPPELAGVLTPDQRTALLAEFGLESSTWVQFKRYISGILRGDLLISVRYGRPVLDILLERLPWTLLLTGSALLLTTLIGTLAGFWSAWRRGKAGDTAVLSAVLFVDAMPGFFVGMMFILIFAVQLGWFPIYGTLSASRETGIAFWLATGRRLIMPVATLALATLAPIYLAARSALVTELREDYVLMAEAKGLDQEGVRRHAQRNALLPLSSLLLLNMGTLIGGAALIETVFSYPGLGWLLFQGVAARDYPLLQGAFLLMAVAVIAANFLGGLLYPLLDPRLRRAGAS